jgi:hypothetical protein
MGTTAKWGYPYPEPTDPVADGAAAIRALAEAIDVSPPRGVVGYVERMSNAGPLPPVTGHVALGGLSFTVTLTTRRYLHLSAYCRHALFDAAGNYGTLSICDASGYVYTDAIVVGHTIPGTALSQAIAFGRVIPANPGTYTFGLWAESSAGNLTLVGTGNSPIWISVEDLGPAA